MFLNSKRTNELDDLLTTTRPNGMISTHRTRSPRMGTPSIITPSINQNYGQNPLNGNRGTRKYPKGNQFHSAYDGDRSKNVRGHPMMPCNPNPNQIRSPSNRQPLKLQQYSQTTVDLVCQNHPSKTACFQIDVDNENIRYYCERCAAQLAAQGFQVQPIDPSSGYDGVQQSSQQQSPMDQPRRQHRPLPHLPEYQHNLIYKQVLSFLQQAEQVSAQHWCQLDKFTTLQSHYQQQLQLTSNFYDGLIVVLQQMKNDHLQDLMLQRQKYLQIADIECENLRENMIEIQAIRNDIEGNLSKVLQQIEGSQENQLQYRTCMDEYMQKITLYQQQVEEQGETLKEVTRYTSNMVDAIVQDFQGFLAGMWDNRKAQQDEDGEMEMGQMGENRDFNRGDMGNEGRGVQFKPVQRQQQQKEQANIYDAPLLHQKPALNRQQSQPTESTNTTTRLQNHRFNTNTPMHANKTQQAPMTVKDIHQILPRSGLNQPSETKRAFRNLSGDEQLLEEGNSSPIFKNF